ncbi:EF-hand domain-containing family member B [Tachyglossus aculeatus]|uniref:EF-hand domain-containing family member B n=1 Tax=Tachyglossus aculeatus TaxID=9261 RepID=UPI0018F5B690|nr:EF-hand domain-containing family member B [Tachyglossus aculeatus]
MEPLGAAQAFLEHSDPDVEPPDHIRPVYRGRFVDRFPCWPSAGKLYPIGHRVAACLTEKRPRLITPPVVRKFLNTSNPPPGAERVFYGRANDPNIAAQLTHGKRNSSFKAGTLINPSLLSTCERKLREKRESFYFSNQLKPLGKSYDQTSRLPKNLDIVNTTFGTTSIRGLSARELINPPKSFDQVFRESEEGRDLYIISHNGYGPGEAKNRKYNPASFHRFKTYGLETPHFNDGWNLAKSLYWRHNLQLKNKAQVVSKINDDFKEKFHPQLGKVLDPIAETMNVPPGHTFGKPLLPDEYGFGDLLRYYRLPSEFLRHKDQECATLVAVRHYLKNVNYHNFQTLLAAFRHFDQDGDGKIDKEELQKACCQANLDLEEELLEALFDFCDLDQVGRIDYKEFANFLNWKDRMVMKEFEEKILTRGRKLDSVQTPLRHDTTLLKAEDIKLKESGGSEKTPKAPSRPTGRVFSDYRTTSSQINAIVGGLPLTYYPMYGIPTIRSDIPAPRIRSITDEMNYGGDGTAYALLYPSVYSQKRVFESDFFKTRSKEEIARILRNIGVNLSDENFEELWTLASKKQHNGEVCVETILKVLDEMQHASHIKCQ